MSVNLIAPQGEEVTIVDTAFDYGKTFMIINGSATKRADVFCNIPMLGAGTVCSFAYVAAAGGAEEFSVFASSNNNVCLATLKSNEVVTVRVVRDCDTWYSTDDCFEREVSDLSLIATLVARTAVEAPVVEATTLEAVLEEVTGLAIEAPVEAPVDVPVDALCSDSCSCESKDLTELD